MNNHKNYKKYSGKDIFKRIDDLERRSIVITISLTFIGIGVTLSSVGVPLILSKLSIFLGSFYLIVGVIIAIAGIYIFSHLEHFASIIKLGGI